MDIHMTKHKSDIEFDTLLLPTTVHLRSIYDGLEKKVSLETGISFPEPTLTQQQFKDECNPNFVMEQFTRTGDASILEKSNPRYGDFTGVGDYHTSLNIVRAADEAFASLPATLRTRFHNNPAEYVEFVSNDANRAEMIKLGMLREDLSIEPVEPHGSSEGAVEKSAGKGAPAAATIL